jgi:hypothetical protein
MAARDEDVDEGVAAQHEGMLRAEAGDAEVDLALVGALLSANLV